MQALKAANSESNENRNIRKFMIACEADVSPAEIRLETSLRCTIFQVINFIYYFVIFRKAEAMHFGTELQVSGSVKF